MNKTPDLSAIMADYTAQVRAEEKRRQAIRSGRRYLMGSQLDDGGWLATTRPPKSESYAQRMSTTAWATLALVSTAEQ